MTVHRQRHCCRDSALRGTPRCCRVAAATAAAAGAPRRCRSPRSTSSASPCPTWTARSPSTPACCRSRRCRTSKSSGRPYELLTGVFGARSRVVAAAARRRRDRADRVPGAEGPADARRLRGQRSRCSSTSRSSSATWTKAYARAAGAQRRARVDRPAAPSRLEPERRRHQRVLLPRSRSALSRDHLRFPPDKGQPKWHARRPRCFSASTTPRSSSTTPTLACASIATRSGCRSPARARTTTSSRST